MPHVTLEYSNNLPKPVDFPGLFRRIHEALVGFPPIKLSDIKSRATGYDTFLIGAGNPETVFVHLTVAVLKGRTIDERKKMSEKLLQLLEVAFHETYLTRPCDITVDIREIERETYGKLMNELARQVAKRE